MIGVGVGRGGSAPGDMRHGVPGHMPTTSHQRHQRRCRDRHARQYRLLCCRKRPTNVDHRLRGTGPRSHQCPLRGRHLHRGGCDRRASGCAGRQRAGSRRSWFRVQVSLLLRYGARRDTLLREFEAAWARVHINKHQSVNECNNNQQ